MKPILYSKDETQFLSNGIGVLYDALECTVEEERNGMFECSMVYPIGGQWFSEIKLDRIILVKASLDPSRQWQPFRIYKISKPLNGQITAYARHISYQLNDILVKGFEAASVPDVFAKFKSELLDPGSCPFTFWTNHSSSASDTGYSYDFVAPIRSRLGGTEGSVLDIWHGEYEWDRWTVKFYDSMGLDTGRGKDRGVVFRYGKDISDMTQESDIGELVTRIYPYFQFEETITSSGGDEELSDGEDYSYSSETVSRIITLDEKYVSISNDQMDRYSFAYHRTAMVDMTNEFEYDRDNPPSDSEIKQAMRQRAESMLALQGIVNENNSVSIIPSDDIVELCDVVGIENEVLGISVSTKIKKVTFDALGEKYTSLEIGDLKTDFTESIKSDMAASTSAAVTEAKNAIEVDVARANTVIANRINANRADIQTLFSEKVSTTELDAQKARITDLETTRATIDSLTAVDAKIGNLTAGKTVTGELEAANAAITNLNTDYANIKSLIAGNAAVGDLTAIHLTTANSAIDSAVINNIIGNYATLRNLVAGKISTGELETSGIKIVGNVIQVVEDDGQGGEVVKMQMGEDAQGNFTFAIFGDNNTVLLDENGLHQDGVPNGLIVDRMVKAADDEYLGLGANKLNIDNVSESIVNNINGTSKTINSDKIFFSQDNHTLTQVYSEMTSRVESAEAAAKSATDAIAGIDTLSSINVWLSNDFHVVHAAADGSTTTDSFKGCYSRVYLFMGDVDITSKATSITATPSTGVGGIFNSSTNTYTVISMTTDTGYVDFSVVYTSDDEDHTQVTFSKRFSLSKIKDGDFGTTYSIVASPERVTVKEDGTMSASSIKFSFYSTKNGTRSAYRGTYNITVNVKGGTGTSYIGTGTDKTITIDNSVSSVRCVLKDSSSSSSGTELDRLTVEVTPDLDEMAASIQSNTTRVGTVETGLSGLTTRVGTTENTVTGVTNRLNNTLLFNITHKSNANGTTTVTAHVWNCGVEVTNNYAATCYEWFKKTENGEVSLGTGYSVTVTNSDFEFTGVVIGRFTTQS